MTPASDTPLRALCRRALTLGHWNGALWAAGNALTSGFLVSYLAMELGARGRQLALLLATPMLAGLLRLAAPGVIRRSGGVKRAAVGLSVASYVLIAALPWLGISRGQLSDGELLAALIVLVCVHQLLEYLAAVAIFTWLDEWIPPRVRSGYFGRRQAWQLAVQVPLAIAGAAFADYWTSLFPPDSALRLVGYAVPNGVGAALLLASVVPLAVMPAGRRDAAQRIACPAATAADGARAARETGVLAALADRRFRRLLAFRVWFSLANGITQTVQSLYPKQVLALGASDLTVMRIGMQCGQLGLARPVGKWADRLGNRPVIALAQACVTAGLAFYLVASPASRATAWLLAGAWLLWSAYVAHNVCLPSLVLKLSPPGGKPAYFALHEGLASACHAGATLAGGWLFDALQDRYGLLGSGYDAYATMFVLGVAARALAVPLVLLVAEPGARRLSDLIRRSA